MGSVLLVPVLILFSNYLYTSDVSNESKTSYTVFLIIIFILWLITRII